MNNLERIKKLVDNLDKDLIKINDLSLSDLFLVLNYKANLLIELRKQYQENIDILEN